MPSAPITETRPGIRPPTWSSSTRWLDAVGTYNRYAVGSVDQNAVHVVAEAMYGSPLMVPVSDIDHCDYFLLVGANPAVSAWNWLETVPGGWRRALERQRRGATIVVVDPVRTETAEKADLHLAVRPGQDWALLLAMVKVILDEGREHTADCADLATGVDDLRRLVADADLDDLAARCDIPRAGSKTSHAISPPRRAAMVVTRTGVSLHAAGTVAEWLGHVLNVITGRMDRPGGRRFEPGYVDTLRLAGLAKTPPHTSRLTGRGLVAGAHALADLPDEIVTPGRGRIRAMVINSGNPVVSGPDGARLDAALGQLDLLVAIDFVQRESHRHAHWILPAAHWLERNDLLAFTSGMHDEPFVQYGVRAVEPPPGRARGVADLHRSGHRHAQAVVRGAWAQHVHHHHPATGADDGQARTGVHPALDRPAAGGDLTKSQRAQGQMARTTGTPARPGAGSARVRPLPRRAAHRRQKVHAAPPEFVGRARELLAGPHPAAPERYPFQLGNRRSRHSMNSWLNELPGLHPAGKPTRCSSTRTTPRRRASTTAVGCGCSPPSPRSN